ncbi:MAG: transglycosylase SLT domain-containing protein [Rhodobacteraceae bacterium]|nr:transglycosylase SLT domain-containing protein [Paracoccaceae bacterium]
MPKPRLAHHFQCRSRIGPAMIGVVLGLSGAIATAAPMTQSAEQCIKAGANAAQALGVPLDVMQAIALVETGRRIAGQMQPWPWAVHAQGQGHWPATRSDAKALIRGALDQGQRNIDIGCFQINYHWHRNAFPTLDAMLDPQSNADYAARLLRGHYQRLGSWRAAAGAYHSLTPHLAQSYLARFDALRPSAPGPRRAVPAPPPLPPDVTPRATRYALLQASSGGALGSLVPQSALEGAPPLLDMAQARAGLGAAP